MTNTKLRYRRIVAEPSPELVANLPDGEMPPAWMRTTFIDEDCPYREIDRVFLPVEAFGKPLELFLMACYDRASLIIDAGHVYAPASWLMQEFPQSAEKAQKIADRVLEIARDK